MILASFQTLGSKWYWQSSRHQAANEIGNIQDFKDICYLYNTKQQHIYNYLNNIILCTLNYQNPIIKGGMEILLTSTYLCLSQGMSFLLSFLCCSLILGERQLFPLLILVEIMTFNAQYQYVSSYNRYSNMTSFKRFGSKPVVIYAYIGISADRQRHNLFWQLYKNKYRICPI